MNCNCNQNRRCNSCSSFGRAQHIRVGQNAANMMGNGPCCCRHSCCCRCCQCNRCPNQPTIDYACLRRATRDFERRVARCMGLCGFNENSIFDDEESVATPYSAFGQKYNENE